MQTHTSGSEKSEALALASNTLLGKEMLEQLSLRELCMSKTEVALMRIGCLGQSNSKRKRQIHFAGDALLICDVVDSSLSQSQHLGLVALHLVPCSCQDTCRRTESNCVPETAQDQGKESPKCIDRF